MSYYKCYTIAQESANLYPCRLLLSNSCITPFLSFTASAKIIIEPAAGLFINLPSDSLLKVELSHGKLTLN